MLPLRHPERAPIEETALEREEQVERVALPLVPERHRPAVVVEPAEPRAQHPEEQRRARRPDPPPAHGQPRRDSRGEQDSPEQQAQRERGAAVDGRPARRLVQAPLEDRQVEAEHRVVASRHGPHPHAPGLRDDRRDLVPRTERPRVQPQQHRPLVVHQPQPGDEDLRIVGRRVQAQVPDRPLGQGQAHRAGHRAGWHGRRGGLSRPEAIAVVEPQFERAPADDGHVDLQREAGPRGGQDGEARQDEGQQCPQGGSGLPARLHRRGTRDGGSPRDATPSFAQATAGRRTDPCRQRRPHRAGAGGLGRSPAGQGTVIPAGSFGPPGLILRSSFGSDCRNHPFYLWETEG